MGLMASTMIDPSTNYSANKKIAETLKQELIENAIFSDRLLDFRVIFWTNHRSRVERYCNGSKQIHNKIATKHNNKNGFRVQILR